MKIYSATNIVIIVLMATALGLGYVIFQQRTSPGGDLPKPISSQIETPEAPGATSIEETAQGEFTLFVGPNTKIFGIDPDNPYKGEPPATIIIGGGGIPDADLTQPFEILGDVLEVDLQEQAVRITSDYPRNIDTEFTPRGPRISLQDIKKGDRVVASGSSNKEGAIDFRDIDFIQVLPPE